MLFFINIVMAKNYKKGKVGMLCQPCLIWIAKLHNKGLPFLKLKMTIMARIDSMTKRFSFGNISNQQLKG